MKNQSTLEELSKIAKEIKIAYAQKNRREGKKVWQAADYARGLAGDVADLIKLLGAAEKNPDKDTQRKLRHELADCLWSVIAVAQELNVDLEKEFLINLEYLKQKFFEKEKR